MKEKNPKTYIDVIVRFCADGFLMPLELLIDSQHFVIQKVLDVRPAASMKAGGAGIRYTCLIDGVNRYIYLEDVRYKELPSARWFVETDAFPQE